MSVADNLANIQKQIADAAKEAGRLPEEISLLAVSKRHTMDLIREAIAAGQPLFGENYVQEGEEKALELKRDPDTQDAKVHFIGNLQRNKAKRAVGTFDVIETVDRIELAELISKLAVERNIEQKILLQINVSGEESKSGVLPDEAEDLCKTVASLPGVILRGLMSIGAFVDNAASDAEKRQEFIVLRELRDSLQQNLGLTLPELSMGMSHNFDLAIQEGATTIRVGTAIFGPRP